MKIIYVPISCVFLVLVFFTQSIAQNYVHSGGEQFNFSIQSLSTSSYWGTDRSSNPGFFSANGSHYSGADEFHAIDGYVKYYGNGTGSAFSAPVGSGDVGTQSISEYRSVLLSGGNLLSSTDIFATAWFAGDPSSVTDPSDGSTHSLTAVTAPVVSVCSAGFWDWIDYNGTLAGKTVSVRIPDVSGFATTENLRLVGWNGSSWINLSNPFAATGNTEGSTLTGTLQSNITALGIGSLSSPLPVAYAFFTAQLQPDCSGVILKWQTVSEQHSRDFTVQRSIDGRNWTTIGTIAAAGNSHKPHNYTFNDNQVSSRGTVLYRLRQNDLDGKYMYSNALSVQFGCPDVRSFFVYPNPVANELTIRSSQDNEGILTITDITGRVISERKLYADKVQTLNTTSWSSGMYLLKIAQQGRTVYTEKIAKQ